MRRVNFETYNNAFSKISEIQFLNAPSEFQSNRWLTCIQTPSFEFRENIRLGLEKENIESRPLWKPMHQQPIFQKYTSYINGVSDNLFEKGLCLPSGSNLSKEDISFIIKCIKKLI